MMFFIIFVLLIISTISSADSGDWKVGVKTCDVQGGGTNARSFLKVFYDAKIADYQDGDDSDTFALDSNDGRDILERGDKDYFRLRLNDNDVKTVGLFYVPGSTLGEAWCVDWVTIQNENLHKCYVAIFDRWISSDSDQPTYPKNFRESKYTWCNN